MLLQSKRPTFSLQRPTKDSFGGGLPLGRKGIRGLTIRLILDSIPLLQANLTVGNAFASQVVGLPSLPRWAPRCPLAISDDSLREVIRGQQGR